MLYIIAFVCFTFQTVSNGSKMRKKNNNNKQQVKSKREKSIKSIKGNSCNKLTMRLSLIYSTPSFTCNAYAFSIQFLILSLFVSTLLLLLLLIHLWHCNEFHCQGQINSYRNASFYLFVFVQSRCYYCYYFPRLFSMRIDIVYDNCIYIFNSLDANMKLW